jgi:hypothetical protein
MKKLSKDDLTSLQQHVEAMHAAWEAMHDAVETYNGRVATAWGDVESAVSTYNGAVEHFHAWQTEIASAIREYIGERSEKWQAGPTGQAYEGWIEPFENDELIDAVELDAPEPLELDVGDPAEAVYDLADEPME